MQQFVSSFSFYALLVKNLKKFQLFQSVWIIIPHFPAVSFADSGKSLRLTRRHTRNENIVSLLYCSFCISEFLCLQLVLKVTCSYGRQLGRPGKIVLGVCLLFCNIDFRAEGWMIVVVIQCVVQWFLVVRRSFLSCTIFTPWFSPLKYLLTLAPVFYGP